MKEKFLKLADVQQRAAMFASPMLRKAEDGKSPMFVGESIVFNKWSVRMGDFKEIIYPEAINEKTKFDEALAVFNHREDNLLGTYAAGTLRTSKTETGIYVEIDEANTTISQNCKVWVERKEITGMSFKFYVGENGSKWVWNRDEQIYEHHISDIAEILDISLVTRPAYQDTSTGFERSFSAIKSELETLKGLEMEPDSDEVANYNWYMRERAILRNR